MKERINTYVFTTGGTTGSAGTSAFVTPIPLRFLGASLYSKDAVGSVAFQISGGTIATLDSGEVCGTVANITVASTAVPAYKGGTAFFGAGTAIVRVPINGTVTVVFAAGTASNAAVLYALSGE